MHAQLSTKISQAILLSFFLLACTLFVFMYMAAESLEQLADQEAISGPEDIDIRTVAYSFAAEWRHGMAGNSALYMPGFFVVSTVIWIWAIHRSLRQMVKQGLALVIVAVGVAWLLAPLGANSAIATFTQQTGLDIYIEPPGPTVRGILIGLYTLFTWSVGMISCQRSIARRSFHPMWIPIGLNIILANIRPWTVGEFTKLWIERASHANMAAIFSLAAFVILYVALVVYQLRSEAAD